MLPVFRHYISEGGLQPLDIVFFRFVLATPLIWLLALRLPAPDKSEKPLPRWALLAMGGFLMVAATTAFFGLRYITAGTFVVLFYTYPAMVALFSALLGVRLNRSAVLALALTLVGVALTVPGFGVDTAPEALLGVGLALLNALVVAVYIMVSSRVLRGHTAIVRASAWLISGALLFMVLVVPFSGLRVPQSAPAWLNLIGLAAISTVLPIFSLNTAIQKLGPTRTSIWSTLEPLITAFFAFLFIGEQMLPIQLVGGALVLAGAILFQIRQPDGTI